MPRFLVLLACLVALNFSAKAQLVYQLNVSGVLDLYADGIPGVSTGDPFSLTLTFSTQAPLTASVGTSSAGQNTYTDTSASATALLTLNNVTLNLSGSTTAVIKTDVAGEYGFDFTVASTTGGTPYATFFLQGTNSDISPNPSLSNLANLNNIPAGSPEGINNTNLEYSGGSGIGADGLILDYSVEQVPEPSSFALAVLCAIPLSALIYLRSLRLAAH